MREHKASSRTRVLVGSRPMVKGVVDKKAIAPDERCTKRAVPPESSASTVGASTGISRTGGKVSPFNTSKALCTAVLVKVPGSDVEVNFAAALGAIALLQALRQTLLIRFTIAAKVLAIATNLVSPNIE